MFSFFKKNTSSIDASKTRKDDSTIDDPLTVALLTVQKTILETNGVQEMDEPQSRKFQIEEAITLVVSAFVMMDMDDETMMSCQEGALSESENVAVFLHITSAMLIARISQELQKNEDRLDMSRIVVGIYHIIFLLKQNDENFISHVYSFGSKNSQVMMQAENQTVRMMIEAIDKQTYGRIALIADSGMMPDGESLKAHKQFFKGFMGNMRKSRN